MLYYLSYVIGAADPRSGIRTGGGRGIIRTFKIYQVPEDSRFFHDFGFRALDGLRRAHLGPPLPREAYELVYVWNTDADPSLDWVFCHFNHTGMLGIEGPPADYHGRSLSVGDVVETDDGHLWFCDAFGWAPVSWAPQTQNSMAADAKPRSEAPNNSIPAEARLQEEKT